MANNNQIPDFNTFAQNVKRKVIITAEVEGMRFIQSNFDNQGFTDLSFTPWAPRSPNLDVGRPILRGAPNPNLRNSIKRKSNIALLQVEFTADVEHAEIHNSGGETTVSPAMKRFFWRKFYESGGKGVKEVNLSPVQKFYKAMALMAVGKKIKIPQRQFMGDSQFFANKLDTDIATIISNEFNTIKQL